MRNKKSWLSWFFLVISIISVFNLVNGGHISTIKNNKGKADENVKSLRLSKMLIKRESESGNEHTDDAVKVASGGSDGTSADNKNSGKNILNDNTGSGTSDGQKISEDSGKDEHQPEVDSSDEDKGITSGEKTANDDTGGSDNNGVTVDKCDCTTPSSNNDDDSNDEHEEVQRTLKAGDFITAIELLPVTKRLIKKLDMKPGSGRGIVSSAKSPEDLADKLFAAFFMTMKRIVTIEEIDIPGLDALQALALDGDAKNFKYFMRTVTQQPPVMVRRSDQWFAWNRGTRRCHFKLLTKKVQMTRREFEKKKTERKKNKIKALVKKLPKNRHLIVNTKTERRRKSNSSSYRRQSNDKSKNKTSTSSNLEKRKRHNKLILQKMKIMRNAIKRPGCTWSYECRNPDDLDTCKLLATCMNETFAHGEIDDILPRARNLKEDAEMQSFRRLLGLAAIDEEVERIIENHVYLLKPQNMHKNERLESLVEYFNSIIAAQNSQSTIPLHRPTEKTPIESNDNTGDSDKLSVGGPSDSGKSQLSGKDNTSSKEDEDTKRQKILRKPDRNVTPEGIKVVKVNV